MNREIRICKQINSLSWKVAVLLALFTFHFSLFTSHAQSFTQRIQQQAQGEGTVTIHQDKSIDDLVNKPAVVNSNTTTTKKQPEPKKQQQTDSPKNVASSDKETKGKNTPVLTEQSDSLDSDKKLTRGIKMNGYRVQVFAGGNSRKDRQNAEAARNRVKELFPDEAVSVHFHSPRWICRAGNFRTFEEAHQMLEDVKALGYKSAIIIKTKITVQE